MITSTGRRMRPFQPYLALRNGRQALVFWDIALSDDVGEHAAEMDRADLVIAAEPDSLEIPGHLPSTRILGETLALVRSRDDFREVASFLTVNGKRFFLFERVLRLASD